MQYGKASPPRATGPAPAGGVRGTGTWRVRRAVPETARSGRRSGGGTAAGLAALVLATVLWGGSFVLTKVALRELSVLQLLLLRFWIAVLAISPVVLWRGGRPPRLRPFLLAGLLSVPVAYLLQVGGVALTTAGSAALVSASLPPLLAAAAHVFGGTPVSRVEKGAIAVSCVGVAMVAGWPGAGRSLAGDGLVFLSVLATVGWALLSLRLLQRHSATVVATYPLWLGTVMLTPLALLRDGVPPLGAISPTVWMATAALGLGCTAAAYLVWTWGLRRVPPARAGIIANLEPLVGVVLALAVLGEPFTPGTWLGGGLIMAAAIGVAWYD